MLQQLRKQYEHIDCRDLGSRQLEHLRDGLKSVTSEEIKSSKDGRAFIELLRKLREAIAENDKLHGENYPNLLNSLLSVGEDGLYSNSLRFIFELIQNVDDCDYRSLEDCRLDMHFDFSKNEITLTYNEVGFTPFNVFAITGIAEAAKNVSAAKNEIGEKGIGFKSVFGVAKKVLIRSGWFSFELYKENFTIPVPAYLSHEFCPGTQMTLYVPGRAKQIYGEIKKQYCRKDALFSKNPLLFLNKLTSLKMYFDSWRSMEFHVSRTAIPDEKTIQVERDVELSVDLHDYENGLEVNVTEQIQCSRYSYPVVFSRKACQSRYGENTKVGSNNGKPMILRVVLPHPEYLSDVGMGSLYSFLPTQLKLTVPLVCHVPFKLDASREFVDPQDENIWFNEASVYLSELIDYAYMNWRSEVNENIVQCIPSARDNLFACNNGKEQCLSRQKVFSGEHYLSLPLFLTMDGEYHKADDIFCFDHEEGISKPEVVYRLMGYTSFLFVPPVAVNRLRLKTETNVKDSLFKRALSIPSITSEALDYLDEAKYFYSEKQLPGQGTIELTAAQVETIFKHKKLAAVVQSLGCTNIQKNMCPKFKLIGGDELNLADALYDDFELSETPRQVERYLTFCHEKCICLDIEDDDFLPCYNAIILSKKNALASFAAFCYAIDQRDTFAIRIKLREASKRLNQFVEEEKGSASDYLRNLRNVRLLIQESLGNNGYRSYIDLILKSGTDRGRFIQELLQNADDCDYLPDVTPEFSLMQKGKSVFTEYNEVGFNRANIRSITAIGESTKNKLFNGQFAAIGEKGVGFKTIFAVASEVRIHSGEYFFSLTDREPTIPRALRSAEGNVTGTRMEVILKDQSSFPAYNEKAILELCLCLRKLKSIKIGSHSVTIEDTDGRRTITIDRRQHVFKRFTHDFTVTDENALKERRNGTRAISSDQTIVCFVPERGGLADYALYNGLPTKHRIKIPMVIDAPFALTTSREEIETESSAWNNIVRRELYSAILSVIDELKEEERAKILRFTRFVPRFQGNIRVYVNDVSDCNYLTSYDFLSVLKTSPILPTFEKGVFGVPRNKAAYRFPDAATILFERVSPSEYAGISPASIIDVEGTDYEAALNAMECATASFSQAFPIIAKHAEHFIRQEDFRPKLYEFLQDTPHEYKEQLKRFAIIPVYGKISESVDYIPWKDDSIFVKKGAVTSGADYYVLDEKLLSKSYCEKMFDANINEMNAEWERSRYNERLKRIIQGNDLEKIYKFLIGEFRSGALRRNESFATLYAAAESIPLKNELGEIVDTTLFLCDQPTGYFPVEMIQRLIVHKECAEFAAYMHCDKLSGIHYDDVDYYDELTADDVETLLDDYFVNSEEILRGFYRDGRLSDELLSDYDLEYLAVGREADYGESYEFPSDPVRDRNALQNHVKKQWQSPVKVVAVKVERTVHKGQNKDGSTFDLGIRDTRDGALRIYSREGTHDLCFCQMCHRVKPYKLIEVNNIEVLPRYYFPQLRISLCLECSKRFEFLRGNPTIRNDFLAAIKKTSIQNQGKVDVRIGRDYTITFTAKHLAEIQEILKQMPDEE